MRPDDNQNAFTGNPLDRASERRPDRAFIDTALADSKSVILPFWRGDPLIANKRAAFLATAARAEFPPSAPVVFLGVDKGAAHFAVDASALAETADAAPFADIGEYMPLRQAAALLPREDLSIIGQARWLFEWHRRHRHCAVCGAPTDIADGGAKRVCATCKAEHFPRTDPVAIVLAVHGDSCLLGRGPHFPPGFLSALAGFIEPCETPEECARRELFEEAGVRLSDVRYQFSQPWPFPSSLMMGFIADAEARELTLDPKEIEEARWIERADIEALLNGEARGGIFLPPQFTIARRLIERWAAQ